MKGKLEVLEEGLLTTVQDRGRFGYRKYGVPISGTMDSHAAELANWLVGNNPDQPVFEITMKGVTFKFLTDAVIGISGAKTNLYQNGEKKPINTTVRFGKGDVLSIQKPESGFRSYMAIQGNLDVDLVMESYSTCLQAEFGGFKGRKLKKGDMITWQADNHTFPTKAVPEKLIPHFANHQKIRVLPGPEWGMLNTSDQSEIIHRTFKVTGQSNRMGIRLKNSFQQKGENKELRSAPVLPGTVQLPPSGEPIILMNDAQSVGGYPRILQVVEAELWRLGQVWRGNEITFNLIDFKDALELLEYYENFKQDLLY